MPDKGLYKKKKLKKPKLPNLSQTIDEDNTPMKIEEDGGVKEDLNNSAGLQGTFFAT